MAGRAIARGSPGNPAPEPRSTSEPADGGSRGERARASRIKRAISSAAVRWPLRLMRSFQRSSSPARSTSWSRCAPVSARSSSVSPASRMVRGSFRQDSARWGEPSVPRETPGGPEAGHTPPRSRVFRNRGPRTTKVCVPRGTLGSGWKGRGAGADSVRPAVRVAVLAGRIVRSTWNVPARLDEPYSRWPAASACRWASSYSGAPSGTTTTWR